MSDQKTEQKPDHEKRIREASNYALDNEWSYLVVGNADLRALLADLDAMRGALKSVQAAIYMDDAGQLRLTRSFDESTIDAALSEAKAGGWVAVPVQVLQDASEALGNFVSDHGWGDSDMQAMDNLDAYIATHKARTAPPAQRGEG